MSGNMTPPPIPVKRNYSLGVKAFLLAMQCVLLMTGVLAVWLLSYSRHTLNKDVAGEIAKEWGGSAQIDAPTLRYDVDSEYSIQPTAYTCNVSVTTESLHRNIYEAEVFDAHVVMSGTFNKDDILTNRDSLYFELAIPTQQATKLSALKIGGKTQEFQKSDMAIFTKVDISDMPQIIEFSTEFDIRGSGSIWLQQVGDKSVVTINGEAPNPSFQGNTLPNDRKINGKAFSARWESEGDMIESDYSSQKLVGTEFLVGVDRYQMVERSLKYSFLIILLTYVSVFFAEIMMRRNIPMFNYFLIGAALIIFYTLLLSFSEQLAFGLAYTIASTMTVALITGYMWKMLNSAKVGLAIGAILTFMYVVIFILLSISTYALLLGSLLLFAALAAMMYGSLKIKF